MSADPDPTREVPPCTRAASQLRSVCRDLHRTPNVSARTLERLQREIYAVVDDARGALRAARAISGLPAGGPHRRRRDLEAITARARETLETTRAQNLERGRLPPAPPHA